MSTYDAVKDLPLEIDGYELGPLEQEVAANSRSSAPSSCSAAAAQWGRGEEVDYDPARAGALPGAPRRAAVRRPHTLDSFSLLQAGQTEYRRWAFESAALDLALRQAGLSLGRGARRPMQPLRFVVSTRSVARRAVARARIPTCASSSTRTATGRTS